MNHTNADLRRILQNCRTIAVVGLSADWNRPSYFAAKYMQTAGYTVVPVNPRYTEVLGQRCYPDLASIDVPIDMVEVFRRSEDVLPIAEQALVLGVRCLWQQLGIENTQAQALWQQAGRDAVMNRCVKIEHGRLFGGLNLVGVNTSIISAKRRLTKA